MKNQPRVRVARVYGLVIGSGLASAIIGGFAVWLRRGPDDVDAIKSITHWSAFLFIIVLGACLRLMWARAIADRDE